jgi:hypothetical protein
MRHVDADPVDAAVEPEPQDVLELAADGGVAPVQVGLLGQEQVQPVLARVLVVGPGAAAEVADPVVRRTAVRRGVAPDVVVPVRVVAR